MAGERDSQPRPWRNCPDCRGTGWAKGEDKTLDGKSYDSVKRCECAFRRQRPPSIDAQKRAAGEGKEEE